MLTTDPRYLAVAANLAILGIDISTLPRDAHGLPVLSPGEIQRAYRNKLKATHPDRSKINPAQAQAETLEIQTAWNELKRLLNLDAFLRAERDERRNAHNYEPAENSMISGGENPSGSRSLANESLDWFAEQRGAHVNGRPIRFSP
jgi:curved DNA-binding protein CbpA